MAYQSKKIRYDRIVPLFCRILQEYIGEDSYNKTCKDKQYKKVANWWVYSLEFKEGL